MKKKMLLVLILVIVAFYYGSIYLKTKNIISSYDKITLFSYDNPRDVYNDTSQISIENNKLKIHNVRMKDSLILDEKTTKRILKILFTPTLLNTASSCYEPRHILLFYRNSNIIGYFEFCIECGGSQKSESMLIPNLEYLNSKELKKLFKELNIKSYGGH